MKKSVVFFSMTTLAVGAVVLFGLMSGGRDRDVAEALDSSTVTMFKSEGCMCCEKWRDYAVEAGFEVDSRARSDMQSVKEELGVPPDLASCHTSVVDGYVVEGHVPAHAVERLLMERPDVVGIAVAGMPAGAPGMYAKQPESYHVTAFKASGRRYVFAQY